MKICFAADHAGYSLKEFLIGQLRQNQAYSIQDYGCFSPETVDYPDIALPLIQALKAQTLQWGVLICGSGIGMSIFANRFHHVRAAVCNQGKESAFLARAHNNANILCLGARLISPPQALETLEIFLTTPFEDGRHTRRLQKIEDFC